MPIFKCTKCGRKIETEYEACCTKPHSECKHSRSPECCSQPMIEAMDD